MLGVVLAGTLWSAVAAAPVVVAVFPFENLAGRADLDVLKAGLAEMVATDLAAVGGVTVVERARLSAVLGELSLQRDRAFDPATAAKAGKLLGATHGVVGAITAVAPQVRLDARLVSMAQGTVVAAASVAGAPDALLDLQGALVAKLLTAMGHAPAAAQLEQGKWTRPGTLQQAVDYSAAAAAMEAGRVEEGRAALLQLLAGSGPFTLARVRAAEAAQHLRESAARREAAREELARSLEAAADAYLAGHAPDEKDAAAARRFLAWRHVRTQLLARRLVRGVTPGHPQAPVPGHEAEVRGLLAAVSDGMAAWVAEHARYAAAHTTVFPNGARFLDTGFGLPPEDATRASPLKLRSVPSLPRLVEAERLELELLGRVDVPGDARLEVRPSLAGADEAREARALADAAALMAALDEEARREPRTAFAAVDVRRVVGGYLVETGRRDRALALWQAALDATVEPGPAAQLERWIAEESGLQHNATRADVDAYERGWADCADMPIRKGLSAVVRRRMLREGLAAADRVRAQLWDACRDRRDTLRYVASHLAVWNGEHGRCARMAELLEVFVALGGPVGDAAGYRRNYAAPCRDPVTPSP
ncbi:MAG: hypothetical protein HY904_17045 [Deltaproteobacteria bacterium]|nr:hypothetical protein [Deltaproteobacteria bacterium]